MSTDQIAAVAAFLSGMGSVLSATFYVRFERRKAERDCDKRVAEFERALRAGLGIARDDKA